MTVAVSNPTHKSKAVRVPGGYAVILPGETLTVGADWPSDQRAQYAAAGLVITETKAPPRKPTARKAR